MEPIEGLMTRRRRRRSRRKVERPDKVDDGAGGRSSDLTKSTPEQQEGLDLSESDGARGRSSNLMKKTERQGGLAT
jgi:hypothetical protein